MKQLGECGNHVAGREWRRNGWPTPDKETPYSQNHTCHIISLMGLALRRQLPPLDVKCVMILIIFLSGVWQYFTLESETPI